MSWQPSKHIWMICLLISSLLFSCGQDTAKQADARTALTPDAVLEPKATAEPISTEGSGKDSENKAASTKISTKNANNATPPFENCVSWPDFQAAIADGTIPLNQPVPELPEAFAEGCLFADVGAHTLNIHVTRNGIDPNHALSFGPPPEDSSLANLPIFQLLPMSFGDRELMEQGNLLRVMFDSPGATTRQFLRENAWETPYIDPETHTVMFRYVYMKSAGVDLEILADLLFEAYENADSEATASTVKPTNPAEPQLPLNPGDVIGEWSESGECNTLRRIYTRHGRFGVLRNQNGEWREVFANSRVGGAYHFVDEDFDTLPGAIELTSTVLPAGAFIVGVHELTPNVFRAELLIDGDEPSFESTSEVTTYVRCPNQIAQAITKEEAVDRVFTQLQADDFYAGRLSLDCLTFLPFATNEGEVKVEVRENHGSDCPGNPDTAPLVDTFLVTSYNNLMVSDFATGEFIPYEKFSFERQ